MLEYIKTVYRAQAEPRLKICKDLVLFLPLAFALYSLKYVGNEIFRRFDVKLSELWTECVVVLVCFYQCIYVFQDLFYGFILFEIEKLVFKSLSKHREVVAAILRCSYDAN